MGELTPAESDPGRQPAGRAWEAHALGLLADVVSVVRDGRFEWISPAVTALLGYRPDEVVGRTPAELVHPDDGAVRNHEMPAEAGDVVTGRRVRLRHKDGSYRWVQSRLTRDVDPDGSLGAVLMCTRDITEQVELEERTLAAETALVTAVNASPDGFALHRVHRDEAGAPQRFTLLALNTSAKAANPAVDDAVGLDVADYLPDAEGSGVLGMLRRAATKDGPQRLRTTFFHRGRQVSVDSIAVSVDDDTVVATWRDVTTQAAAERVLVDACQQAQSAWDVLHTSLDAIPQPVLLLDVDVNGDDGPDGEGGPDQGLCLVIAHANRAAAAAVGLEPAVILGWELSEAFPSCDRQLRSGVLEAFVSGTTRQTRLTLDGPDGAPLTLEVTVAPVGDQRVVLVAHDVTRHEHERRQIDDLRQRAERAATHDTLTGLPNRTRLEQTLRHALMTCGPDHRVGVVFCDLDRFKSVNDRHGHRAGDLLLKAVAERLAGVLRQDEVAARLSGDEFVLVLPGLEPGWTPDALLRRARDAVQQPVALPAATITPSITFGCYLADPQAVTADREPSDVLAAADRVMYIRKPPLT